MRAYNIEGIVIKRRNSGEADRILTVLTRYSGKLQVKAVGVRRITSRRSSHIELLNLASLGLYKGRVMSLLTEAQTLHHFSGIKADLERIGNAYHLCELVDSLCGENQENEHVFTLLLRTLHQLDQDEDIQSVVHAFEIALLTTLGFFPQAASAQMDTNMFIENILERRLKTQRMLPKFSNF